MDDEVLHVLRVRGTAPDEGSGSDGIVDAGFAVRRRDKLMLTPAGRAEADVRFRVTGEDEEAVQAAYARFLPLNQGLIQICSDWQVRAGGVTNDHSDPTYDWSVIDRLVAQYRDRLRAARRNVEDDQREWLLSPRIDSYHTVWMQLHEDLLLGLGVNRADEAKDDR